MRRLLSAFRLDLRLLVGGIFALTIISAISVLTAPAPPAPPLSVRSAAPDGAMLLREWLERSGYEVREVLTRAPDLRGVDALFVLAPTDFYDEAEANLIRSWVRRGNLLIVMGNPLFVNPLLEPYRVSTGWVNFSETWTPSHAAGPSLNAPPVGMVRLDGFYRIIRQREDMVVHIAAGTTPLVVSFPEGSGWVWIVGGAGPFTNRGLFDNASASLILNMLRHAPDPDVGVTVAFDEFRHGFSDAQSSLFGWLVTTAPGWGVLTGLAVIGVFLVLNGRRFGRAVPLPSDRLLREPVEYIRAMANLFRRSGQRAEMLRHYAGQFRRRLSERYGIDPHLKNEDLSKAIAARDPDVDIHLLNDVLKRLAARTISEKGLVRLVSDMDELLRQLE